MRRPLRLTPSAPVRATRLPAAGLLALGLLVTGCSSSARQASAPAPSPSASPTASPTASATPSPTASPTPSPTPTPVRTTARPVPTPSRTRPPTAPPLAASGVRHAFPVRGCAVSYAHSHHDYPATDVFAARGCTVVAPVTGRVDEVSTVDRWSSSTNRGADRGGLSFSIVGDDGVRYYGSHLSAIGVRAGQRVTAGQPIGAVGNTGDARGIATHVHFGLSWPTRPGIWWVRRGEVYPWRYLDSWRAGGNASPAAAVAAEHRRQGDVPPCRVDC